MKNREIKFEHYPTPAELYALERQARAMRAAEMARLLREAVLGVKTLFSSPETKELHHA